MTVENQEVKQKNSLLENVKNGWLSLPKSRQIILSTVVGVVIVGLVVYGLFFSQTDYTILYKNLDVETAGEIKTALEENGITDYKIGEGGSSILVPSSEVDRIRMDLAVNGVTPASGTGYELFDTSKMGYQYIENLKNALNLNVDFEPAKELQAVISADIGEKI